MASLFVSHSSQDAAKTAELVGRLRAEGFEALFVDFDPDCGIPAGRKWERELYAQLRRADGVLYIASPASAASRWCFAELSLARSISKPTFPVVVVAGTERLALLGDVQWVDLAVDGEDGYRRLLVGLRRAGLDSRNGFAWDQTRSPYPGLEPFGVEDAAVFFGRQAEIDRLLQLLQPTLQHAAGRFVGIVGPSGSGKSSLLRAGLLPRLQRLPQRWVVIPAFRPGQDPLKNLARSLAQAFADRGQSVSSAELTERLKRGPGELTELAGALAETDSGESKVLVVIDQAEELVTFTGPHEQHRFLSLVRGTLTDTSPLWAVATLRSEFLSTAPERAGLSKVIDDSLLVEPLSRSDLAEVIARPAQRAGLEFAPGLVERMVEDTTGGDALPLLAYTLRELYERVGPDATIGIADYNAVGGVVGALQRRADRLRAELGRRGRGALVLPTLLKLAAVEGEAEPTRRRLRQGALSSDEQAVVRAFVDARLLTTDSEDHEATVEVAHEALLRQWAPLRQAIEDSRAWLRLRSKLEREAADWDHRGRRDESYLLRGGRLQAVHDTLAMVTNGERLEGLEREYYDASVAFDRRSRQAERRRRRLTILTLSIALVAIGVAAGAYGVARHEADSAYSRSVAGQATPILDNKLDLGILLSIEAWHLAPTIEARRAALAALSRGEGIEAILRNPNDGAVAATAFSPIEPLLAVGGQDGAIRLWDLRTRRARARSLVWPNSAQQAAGDEIQALAFSPNGRNLAATYNRGSIVIWRLGDGAAARPIALQHQPIRQPIRVVFSPDGKMLAATGLDTRIALWDVGTGRALSPPLGHAKDALISSDAVFADGATVVAASGDGELATWDVRRRIERERMQLPLNKLAAKRPGKVASATLAPGGSRVALFVNDELTVWDARTGKQLARSRRPAIGITSKKLVFNQTGTRLAAITGEGGVELLDSRSLELDGTQPPMRGGVSVGFSANGTSLIVGGKGVTMLWSLKHRRPLTTPLFGIPGSAASRDPSATVAFSTQDSSRLLSVANATLRAWALPGRRPVQEVRVGGRIGLNAVAISADGSSAAFLDHDNKVGVWHLGEQRPSLSFPVDSAKSLALSADGRMLATAGDADGRIRLWDTHHGTQWGRAMPRDPARVSALAFSPRGDLLASADYGQGITLWRIVPARDDTRHLQSLRLDRRLVGHPGAVRSVTFDPKGKRLASGGGDEALLWDAETGGLIGRPILPRSAINALAFAPDGRTIATATADGGLRFWDVPTGRMLGDIQSAGPRALQSVSFNADGQQAASIDETGAILLWDRMLWSADRDAVTERLCATASRNLTPSEWRVFIPGRAYRPTCERWMVR